LSTTSSVHAAAIFRQYLNIYNYRSYITTFILIDYIYNIKHKYSMLDKVLQVPKTALHLISCWQSTFQVRDVAMSFLYTVYQSLYEVFLHDTALPKDGRWWVTWYTRKWRSKKLECCCSTKFQENCYSLFRLISRPGKVGSYK
jgi:hypothetical protein